MLNKNSIFNALRKEKSMINRLEKFVQGLTWRTAQVAQAAMVFVMLVIVANILLRIPWKPIGGTVEIVEMGGAVLLALGVAYTAIMKGHIMVGVLVERFSPRLRGINDIIVNIIALFFSYLLARELFFYAFSMMERGYVTGHLRLPVAPSIFMVAFGFVMLALVLLLDLIYAVILAVKGSETG
jgi:TRAP-type C4-dicarboxylate transport system permease small subunit